MGADIGKGKGKMKSADFPLVRLLKFTYTARLFTWGEVAQLVRAQDS